MYQTFGQISERVSKVATALKAMGLEALDKIAVLSVNCPDWMITMQVGARADCVGAAAGGQLGGG